MLPWCHHSLSSCQHFPLLHRVTILYAVSVTPLWLLRRILDFRAAAFNAVKRLLTSKRRPISTQWMLFKLFSNISFVIRSIPSLSFASSSVCQFNHGWDGITVNGVRYIIDPLIIWRVFDSLLKIVGHKINSQRSVNSRTEYFLTRPSWMSTMLQVAVQLPTRKEHAIRSWEQQQNRVRFRRLFFVQIKQPSEFDNICVCSFIHQRVFHGRII